VPNLRILNIDTSTRDFRAFESLVKMNLYITSVDEALYLPSNLQVLSIDIPVIDGRELRKLKIICPTQLQALGMHGAVTTDIKNLPPIVVNPTLSRLFIGYIGIPRFEGELNVNQFTLRCDCQENVNEGNLPIMPQLTTLRLTCFYNDSPCGKHADKILNNLVKCQNVRKLILDFEAKLIYRKSFLMWHIQEWPNLKELVLGFEPNGEEMQFLKHKSKIMEINVANYVYWTRTSGSLPKT
jgi:hypothetical protein